MASAGRTALVAPSGAENSHGEYLESQTTLESADGAIPAASERCRGAAEAMPPD
jgi:hypothetical protein